MPNGNGVLTGFADSVCGEYIQRGYERGIQSRILESWTRCGRSGLNPYERNIPSPTDSSRFQKRISENLEIIELYQFYIRRFSGLLEKRNWAPAPSFATRTDTSFPGRDTGKC